MSIFQNFSNQLLGFAEDDVLKLEQIAKLAESLLVTFLYLSALPCTHISSRTLQSSREKRLKILKRHLRSVGERSFSFMAPTV